MSEWVTMLKMCFSVAAIWVTLLSGPVTAEQSIVIAIRGDAPPFSMHSEGVYSGFVVEICEAAIDRVNHDFNIVRVPVSAVNRFEALDKDGVSVLCGPVSITPSRLRDYYFSLPIFVSGISYATVIPVGLTRRDPTLAKVAVLRNTTAFSNSSLSLFEEYFGAAGRSIFEDLSILRSESRPNFSDLKSIEVVGNYEEGFEKLCRDEVQYFLGDVDILNNASKRLNEKLGCNSVVASRTLTRELYGVLFSRDFIRTSEGSDFFQEFQSSLFSLFQEGFLAEAFKNNFEGQVRSKELDQLFKMYMREIVVAH